VPLTQDNDDVVSYLRLMPILPFVLDTLPLVTAYVVLPQEETHDFLEKRWRHRVKVSSDDFTDKEAVAAILRITKGNIRLIERLMMQVEHVLTANQLTIVTKEVVETARKNLIIGPD